MVKVQYTVSLGPKQCEQFARQVHQRINKNSVQRTCFSAVITVRQQCICAAVLLLVVVTCRLVTKSYCCCGRNTTIDLGIEVGMESSNSSIGTQNWKVEIPHSRLAVLF